MYFSYVSTVTKRFVYALVILFALCSILGAVGYIFADHIPYVNAAAISEKLGFISTILMCVNIVFFVLLIIFRLARLYNHLGYIILTLFAILSYLVMLFVSPDLYYVIERFLSFFNK